MTQSDRQQQWMRQWRQAAVALAEVRQRELAEMSDSAALAAAERVLAARGSAVPQPAQRLSGLVEQQRRFARGRR